jgi:hypothetical protein
MVGCVTPHTPGSTGAAFVLFGKTRRYIRSPEWDRQRFGGADVSAEQRLADLENTLTQIKLNPAENAPLLAPLLDIPLLQERPRHDKVAAR